MNKSKREHHVTPKLYLKGFVITPGEPFIWVYKRGEAYKPGQGKVTNNPFKASIKIVGVERDFYANPGLKGAGRFEAFENDLEALEKPANAMLSKLVAGQSLSLFEKTTFAAYVIHFSRRGAAGRAMSNSMLPETVMNYEPPDEAYARFGLPRTPETRLYLQAVAMNVALQPGYAIHMHQGVVNAAADSMMSAALGRMTWHLLKAPDCQTFVTCDNPVCFDTTIGLGSSLSELSFPISSRYALLASWWRLSNEFVIEATVDFAREINKRTIQSAVRHVYAGISDESVAAAIGNSSYRFQPISPAKENFRVMELVRTSQRDGYVKQLVELPLTKGTCRQPG